MFVLSKYRALHRVRNRGWLYEEPGIEAGCTKSLQDAGSRSVHAAEPQTTYPAAEEAMWRGVGCIEVQAMLRSRLAVPATCGLTTTRIHRSSAAFSIVPASEQGRLPVLRLDATLSFCASGWQHAHVVMKTRP